MAEQNNNITAITAAMLQGTGLECFSKRFPERFFDVGIAEQHAVTKSAGIAMSGMIPVVAIYSTFLQRAYDQILHDVCLQNVHVVFAVDRGGLVGDDGDTHQGLYDLSYLRSMPNMRIIEPIDKNMLIAAFSYAVNEHKGPIAIRYPRGSCFTDSLYSVETYLEHFRKGTPLHISEGNELTVVTFGNTVHKALECCSEGNINADIYVPVFDELSYDVIDNSVCRTGRLFTSINNVFSGSPVEKLLSEMTIRSIRCRAEYIAYPDEPIVHGSIVDVEKHYHTDKETYMTKICNLRLR